MAQAHQPRFLAESQYLKQRSRPKVVRCSAGVTEIADPAVARSLVPRQNTRKVSDFPSGFPICGGWDSPTPVAYESKQHQHPRLIRILTPGIFFLLETDVDRSRSDQQGKLQHEEHQVF